MGASNSKPQTVQMSNTSPFQISREVLERVEKATKPEKAAVSTLCENCNRATKPGVGVGVANTLSDTVNCEKEPQVQAIAKSWARRSTEIEESQFSKTLDRVHNLFGRPVKWAKANECTADIELMEQQLISCYRQYGTEPLKCAPLAKQYHTYIFNKQVAAVKKTKSEAQNLDDAGKAGGK